MPPFGRERFRIESPLPPDEVAARMAAAVEPVRGFRWSAGPPGRPFQGEVGPDGFRVTRVFREHAMPPVVAGRIAWAAGGGSVVEGTMALHPATAVFAAVWLGLAGLFTVVGGWVVVRDAMNGRWQPASLMLLTPAGAVAYMWVWMAGSFRSEASRALKTLREVAGVTEPVPVP